MGEQTETSEKVDEKVRVEGQEVVTLGPDRVKREHYFELKRDGDGQMVAQCRDCPMGFPIATEEVKDGHIYIHNQIVI